MVTDYTYAEKWNRTGSLYDTAINESVAAEVVASLVANPDTTGFLETASDKLAGDAEYLAGVAGAIATELAGDTVLHEALTDYFASDAEFLSAVSAAVFDAMTTDYAQTIASENLSPTAVFDSDPVTTPAHTFDPLANLGDNGINPGSVTLSFTMSDDSTETFSDPGADGDLIGSVDGAGTINYDTGVIEVTWGTLSAKTGTTATATYQFLRDGLYEGRSPLSSATFTASAEVADEIDVAIQLQDADGQNWNERTMVSVWWCSDADGAVPAGPTGIGGITTEGTSGGVLETISTGMSYQCVTDDTGKLSLTLADDDVTADLTSYLGLMLPNGKYVVSAAIVFNPS